MSEILNPQDAELEEVILGACLIEREAMPMVADRLRPEMFYFEKNALIYAALQAMYRDGRQIDIITVKNELGARGLRHQNAVEVVPVEPSSSSPRGFAVVGVCGSMSGRNAAIMARLAVKPPAAMMTAGVRMRSMGPSGRSAKMPATAERACPSKDSAAAKRSDDALVR